MKNKQPPYLLIALLFGVAALLISFLQAEGWL
jgi:hypothetical protein